MMIQTLAKYRKPIAAIMWFVFYLQLIAPLHSLGKGMPIIIKYSVAHRSTPLNPWYKASLNKTFRNDHALRMSSGKVSLPVSTGIKRTQTNSSGKSCPVPIWMKDMQIPGGMLEASSAFEGGPTSPEAASFKAANADNLVNLFTGDFSYSIPLLDIDGYPVNLFYNGGITMDQDASWVGLGWNINPGTISRNMRGVPDDFDGTDTLTQTENVKPNKTWGGEVSLGGEIFGIKKPSVNFSLGFDYNNYLGPELDLGAGVSLNYSQMLSIMGEKSAPQDSSQGIPISLGLNAKLSSRSGLTLAPSLNASLPLANRYLDVGAGISTSYNSRSGIKSLTIASQVTFDQSQGKNSIAKVDLPGNFHYTINFARPSYMPIQRMPMQLSNTSGQIEFGGGDEGAAITIGTQGFYSESHIATTTILKPLVGYIYSDKAVGCTNCVMDFNRLNDGGVTPNTPVISAPIYDYDVFAIQGEGTGGSIRAYRSDMGFMKDIETTSTDKDLSIGLDLAPPGHYGGNVQSVSTPTRTGAWEDMNNTLNETLNFTGSVPNNLEEKVYFRNPGETTVTNDVMINKIGRDNLVRFWVDGSTVTPRLESTLEQFSNVTGQPIGNLSVSTANTNEPREKRTQVITMMRADEAVNVGYETSIRNYSNTLDANNNLQYTPIPRVGGYRKGHHISEITVLESSGMRYVYGVPVYNTVQRDYSFTVGKPVNTTTNLVDYSPTNEPTTQSTYINSNTSYDGYMDMQQTPAYASSFLLTELLSPDYVDVTGDGITEDDLGRAVKFNYTESGSVHRWRSPRNNTDTAAAIFNKGLYTEHRDDKGMITYGEREVWYMNSIESKSMVAIFHTSPRSDAKGVVSDLDGNANPLENANMKLDSIQLFTKASIKAYGLAGALPIKTVHFDYAYTLCPGTPDNPSGGGKLTLNDIYFTFNGQARASKDMYVFNYGSYNPSYAYNASDRWGTYKDPGSNPASMTNIDYPFTSTTKSLDDQYASAWSLQKILLPSGGQIQVSYEADDYAYVQNQRACNMFNIYGFGSSTNAIQSGMIYTQKPGTYDDNDYVYVQLPTPLQNSNAALARQEIYAKYLQGMNQLALKLFIAMPKGLEPLTIFDSIADYGICPNGTNNQMIYIKLAQVDGKGAIANAALNFLIQNLPGQAFPGYDLSDGTALTDFFNMIVADMTSLKYAFTNAQDEMRSAGKAMDVNLTTSFVRLASPTMFKYGGGHRVKQVVLLDNWNAMTGQYNSQYGQAYDYTTMANINGVPTAISSGVASYEPGIGSEENPFRTALEFEDKLPLASAQYGAIEMPVLETLFPSPVVGYSQVTIRSINRNGTHSDSVLRSAIGKQVTQFYTAYDYPTFTDYTPMNTMDYHHDPAFSFLSKQTIDRRTSSQGFLIETNDMHGKMKYQAAYSESDPNTPISYTRYTYKNTGAHGLNDLVNFVQAGQGGIVTQGNIGVDMELMTDAREFSVNSTGTNYQAQIDFLTFVPFPIFVPTIWPVQSHTENLYRAVTTTKMINFHAVTDSVIVNDKGSIVTTKTIAYDSESGKPILQQTANEFNDPVYNLTLPAYWGYSGMAPAARNIGLTASGVNFANGVLTGLPTGLTMSMFESGDELYVTATGTPTTCPPGSGNAYRLWAVDLMKNSTGLTVPAANRNIVFVDSSGNLASQNGVSFQILRSGHRNNLDAEAEKITCMQNPIQTWNNTPILDLITTDSTVQASAIDYREKWQIDNDEILHLVYYTPECTTVELDSVSCSLGILEKHINPYQKGLLGNYRKYKDYVFYGPRAETNPTINTTIRHNGYIPNFASYWRFDVNSDLVPNTASTFWMWKTKLTKVNSKGQEMENMDTLGRYTAAQYGYAKNLPVAMVRNSRLGASFYEGFEDYSYSESINNAFINPCTKRYIDFSAAGGTIMQDADSNYAHSGHYMLALNGNTQGTLPFAVAASPIDSFNLWLKPDVTQVLNNPGGNLTSVTSSVYSNKVNTNGTRYNISYTNQAGNNLGAYVTTSLMDSCLLSGTCLPADISMALMQYTQITASGTYNFNITVDAGSCDLVSGFNQGMTITIYRQDGTSVGTYMVTNQASQGSQGGVFPVYLCAGIYKIVTNVDESNPSTTQHCSNTSYAWSISGIQATSYASLSTQNGCAFNDPIVATDSMLNQTFAMVPGQLMWFSGWVKEKCSYANGLPCNDLKYTGVHVVMQYPGITHNDTAFYPTGPIIEGWQKIEGPFWVPSNATAAQLLMSSDTARTVYFDDIRIHPYNADMKSYVYDPQSLRLSAILDENNYTTFYDYDQEGQLVRVKVETTQGIKTVTENRTAKQKQVTTVQ